MFGKSKGKKKGKPEDNALKEDSKAKKPDPRKKARMAILSLTTNQK